MDIKIQILIVVVILVIIGGFLYFTEIKKCDGDYDILSLTCNQTTSKPTKTPTPKKPSKPPTPPPTEEQLIEKYGLKGEITKKMKEVLEKVNSDTSSHGCKTKIKNVNTDSDYDYKRMWEYGTDGGAPYTNLDVSYDGMGALSHYLKKGMRFDSDGNLHTRSRFNEEVNHNPFCSKKGYVDGDGIPHPAYNLADELADAADPICPTPCTVGLPKELKDKIM